jgi:imidazolonepropionase
MNKDWDTLWTNARVATMVAGSPSYGLLEAGAVAVVDGRIAWVGPTANIPQESLAKERLDCDGRLVTPGLIDCHTHLVYGGNRAREFELRLEGASYEQIAQAGGGIVATVTATREADEPSLLTQARPRLERLMADGVTTVEIKSGYGLQTHTELKMLRVARELGRQFPIRVRTTFLGAHALPVEYAKRSDAYIELVCEQMLPAVSESGLADAVDAFCEGIGFSPQQVERVFRKAQALALPIKLHAEQLSNLHGAALAARYDALSADHLEYLDEADVELLARHGTAAVLLPGAFYCLRETKLPPLPALRRHGVPVAIASDCNPGSSPVTSLLLILNLACTLFRMTPEEALAGVTRCAAQALDLHTEIGTVEVGKRADLVLWHACEPAELSYRIGDALCDRVLFGGTERVRA